MPDSRDKPSRWINVALVNVAIVVAAMLAPVAWYVAAVSSATEELPRTTTRYEPARVTRFHGCVLRGYECWRCRAARHWALLIGQGSNK